MIFAIGTDIDAVFTYFLSRATRIGAAVQPINLRAVVERGAWHIHLPAEDGSWIEADGERVPLIPTSSYYYRPHTLAPHVQEPLRSRWDALVSALDAWLEDCRGLVVNRPNAVADNATKPLHEWSLIRAGLLVPPSITSSDGTLLQRFCMAGPTVLKPVCGVRADARRLEPRALETYDAVQGPLHLQRIIQGDDVRVHVVGNTVHGELISSSCLDYRTDRRARYRAISIPKEIAQKIVTCTRHFGLAFAGWDFKVDASGTYWCLECNPMPGYSVYDNRLDGGITRALLSLMEGATRPQQVAS